MTRSQPALAASALLLVYGTLKRADTKSPRCMVLDEGGAEQLVSELRLDGFRLLSVSGGAFPTTEKDPTGTIVAELWRVPSEGLWMQLDGIEGHPHFYCRELVTLPSTPETETLGLAGREAWLYGMTPETIESRKAYGVLTPYPYESWRSLGYGERDARPRLAEPTGAGGAAVMD
jgi:gamma-glutamylcyclotransferase (GGCT)/AIG2-like uncharacterized protein YtfP